jgi:hypothetical protein
MADAAEDGGRPRLWPWRISLLLAALLLAGTLWSFYDLWRAVRTTELMIPGVEIRIDWSGVSVRVLFGIVIPVTYAAVAWRKAFPARAGRARA